MGVKIISVNSSVEGGAPSGTLDITQNGEYNISAYEKVDVAVEGGGGGSSDFSTAEVTFLGEGTEYFYCPIMIDGNLYCGMLFGSKATEDRKYSVMTYQGYTEMVLRDATVDNISGDASQDYDTGVITIWGDCTITIS